MTIPDLDVLVETASVDTAVAYEGDGDIIIHGDGQGGGFPDIISDGNSHTEIDANGEEITIWESGGSGAGAHRSAGTPADALETESEADPGAEPPA